MEKKKEPSIFVKMWLACIIFVPVLYVFFQAVKNEPEDLTGRRESAGGGQTLEDTG